MTTPLRILALASLATIICGPTVDAHALSPAQVNLDGGRTSVALSIGHEGSTGVLALNSTTTSPLTPDLSFNPNHSPYTYPVGASQDGGFRVFAEPTGYFLAGSHTDGGSSSYNGFIWKMPLNGVGGSFFDPELPFVPVDVAHVGNTSKYYFTGAYRPSATADYDFGIYCFDLLAHGPCSGFGNNGSGLAVIAIDSNGFHNDFPVKIVAYGTSALFIAGTSASAAGLGNLDVSVAAIDPTLGNPIAGFGNRSGNPGTVVYGFDLTTNGADRTLNVLVTSNADRGGHRVYVVGETQVSANGNDTDGFILALDANTGAKASGFGVAGAKFVYNDLGTTNKQDAIDAAAITRDGQLAMTGHSTDDDGNRILSLAEVDTNGVYRDNFCGGGHCVFPLLTTYDVPVAIVERSGTRDLVVATTLHDDFGTGADGHPFQAVAQFGRTGNALHALAVVPDYTSAIAPDSATSSDLLVDLVSGDILLAGTSKSGALGAQDYDMTLSRFIDTDTIFANQFETVF